MNGTIQTPVTMTGEIFDEGFTWSDYLAQMDTNRERVEKLMERADVSNPHRRAFAAAVEQHGGRLALTVLTEDWCGDAVVVLPGVAKLVQSVPGLEMRVFIRSKSPELTETYAQDDIQAIPVLSLFDVEWDEIGRWVQRPARAHALRAEWFSEHYPDFEQIKATASRERVVAIFDELIQEMMEWYPDEGYGLWNDVLAELRDEVAVPAEAEAEQPTG